MASTIACSISQAPDESGAEGVPDEQAGEPATTGPEGEDAEAGITADDGGEADMDNVEEAVAAGEEADQPGPLPAEGSRPLSSQAGSRANSRPVSARPGSQLGSRPTSARPGSHHSSRQASLHGSVRADSPQASAMQAEGSMAGHDAATGSDMPMSAGFDDRPMSSQNAMRPPSQGMEAPSSSHGPGAGAYSLQQQQQQYASAESRGYIAHSLRVSIGAELCRHGCMGQKNMQLR